MNLFKIFIISALTTFIVGTIISSITHIVFESRKKTC